MSARPTKKWLEIAEIYKKFIEPDWKVDLSDAAAAEMFACESRGGTPSPNNGYAIGKKWMDVFITQYKTDIRKGLLWAFELLEDFPLWWLQKTGIWTEREVESEKE